MLPSLSIWLTIWNQDCNVQEELFKRRPSVKMGTERDYYTDVKMYDDAPDSYS